MVEETNGDDVESPQKTWDRLAEEWNQSHHDLGDEEQVMRNGQDVNLTSDKMYENCDTVCNSTKYDCGFSEDRSGQNARSMANSILSRLLSEQTSLGENGSMLGRMKRSSISRRLITASTEVKPTKRRLWGVGLSLFFAIAFANGMVALVNGIIYSRNPDWSTEKHFQEFGNPYQDIVGDIIPSVQRWYRGLNITEDTSLLPVTFGEDDFNVASKVNESMGSHCLEHWYDSLYQAATSSTDLVSQGNASFAVMTSPVIIQEVLSNMGLSKIPRIRRYLQDLLSAPQPLTAMFESSLQCLDAAPGIQRLACAAEEVYPDLLNNMTSFDQRRYVQDSLHMAIVLDRLTQALVNDPHALQQVADAMLTRQVVPFKKTVAEGSLHDQPGLLGRSMAKYIGMATNLGGFARALAENRNTMKKAMMQLIILEAVKSDILQSLEENARIGLALATEVTFDPSVDDHKVYWALGEDWAQNYMAWNLAFVTSSAPPRYLQQLLVSPVSCSAVSNNGEGFVASHLVSFALSLMQIHRPLLSGLTVDETEAMRLFYDTALPLPKLAATLGKANYHSLSTLADPSRDAVEKLLYDLCDENCHSKSWWGASTNPVTRLSDETFYVYVGFILWVTVLLAGLGLELLVLLSVLVDGWTTKLEVRWRFAQFLFPVLAATTLGLAVWGNYTALIFLVLGLWKFGFPETIMYVYFALYRSGTYSRLHRFTDFLNGAGTVVHHSAASLLIVMLLTDTVLPTKSVISPILVLLMQHWFVLLKYVSAVLYTALEVTLEVWFEWIVFSNLESLFRNHWTAALAANCMLLSHWLYLLAAGLGLQEDIKMTKSRCRPECLRPRKT